MEKMKMKVDNVEIKGTWRDIADAARTTIRIKNFLIYGNEKSFLLNIHQFDK
jgi:hypothetical protein